MVVIAVALAVLAPATALAQSSRPDTTTTVAEPPPELGRSLPRPNAGPEPEDAGDRGGWLQFALFFLLLAGVTFIVVRLFRASGRDGR